jgi:long-chain acyl-CoA synthetase
MNDTGIPDLPSTIAELPFFASGRYPKPDLIGRCEGDTVSYTSSRELVERVRDIGLGLATLGVKAGDRVALLSESRPDWLFTDFAILACGAATVPIYPTLSAEQVGFILRDSEARLVVVSNATQLAKVLANIAALPAVRAIVVIDAAARTAAPVPLVTLDEVASRGHQRIVDGWGVGRSFHEDAKRVRPDDLATIIYTSGTTGAPKGVMLTHRNLMANLDGIRERLDLHAGDTALSFLPLCHAFERVVAYIYFVTGVSMIFAESIDTVARDLLVVRPTVMSGVPRVFEKLHARIVEKGHQQQGVKRVIFDRAMALAVDRGARLAAGQALTLAQRLESRVAEAMVYQRIRDGLGGRMRFVVSGSAPLRVDLGHFFYGIGLPILEGYGLTETSPVISVMPLTQIRFGTVGPPLFNVEVRIADDGEILARGANVMAGYFKRAEETADVVRDGWFHTGDIGALDQAGYLKITDRKKELIVTSGGKKIAPQPIEEALRAQPVIGQAVVIGEGRHYPSALLVPDFAALARALGVPAPADRASRAALIARPDAVASVQQAVDVTNAGLAQFERVKRIALLADDLTVDRGELTPTLKVRRRVIEERYREDIARLYA